MIKGLKTMFTNVLEFIHLKQTIKILRRELDESKHKEQPYIDKINKLKSENRVYKIQNTKLKKKNAELEAERR